MDTQLRTQKKPLVAPVEGVFGNRQFNAAPLSSEIDSTTDRDFQTQLNRAERFGHHFNRVPIQNQTVGAAMQRAGNANMNWYLQRQLVDEEQERDKESEAMQRKIALDDHLASQTALQAKSERSFDSSFADIRTFTNSVQAKAIEAIGLSQTLQAYGASGFAEQTVAIPVQQKRVESSKDETNRSASTPETQSVADSAPVQSSQQPVQFGFLSMLIGALLSPVKEIISGILGGGGGGGGGGGDGGATGGGGEGGGY